MKQHQHAVRQEDFDALLGLLSHDREEAALAYERLRAGLVRFFEFRGCADADALADETLNRVAIKADGFDGSNNVRLTSYVYGFAANVMREYLRSPRRFEFALETDDFINGLSAPQLSSNTEGVYSCLDNCLNKLALTDRQLVVEYYSHDKQEKIATRKLIADRLGCRLEALHTKVFRLKSSLRSCVRGCVEDN